MATLGNEKRVYIITGENNTYSVLKGEQSNSVNRSAESIDISDKDSGAWGSTMPGKKSFTMDVTVYADNDDVNQKAILNAFYTDTEAERDLVRRVAEGAGARFAVSDHWLKGGEGALELARAVIEACDEPNNFAFLCDLSEPIADRIEKQVKEVYGGDGVDFEPLALEKLAKYQANPETASLPICIAKTQYSLSHDAKLLGRPKGWRLPVKDILIYAGAGLLVPVAGEIKLMPGTSASPAYRKVDVDVETGKVKGLF